MMIEPDAPEPGWLDGPRGLVRAVIVLIAAALLGFAYAAAEKALHPPAVEGPRA